MDARRRMHALRKKRWVGDFFTRQTYWVPSHFLEVKIWVA
jgi:hypothetical protein